MSPCRHPIQEPLPRASGWLPKAVVRLVQAFRHSYGLAGDPAVPWTCWEPLLLMVDEVYRRVAAAGESCCNRNLLEEIEGCKMAVGVTAGRVVCCSLDVLEAAAGDG